MVRLTKKNGEAVSFSVKGAGRFFKGLVKKLVASAKEAVVTTIAFLHEKLAQLEDYLLTKLDNAGKWAEKKIDERLPEPEEVIE